MAHKKIAFAIARESSGDKTLQNQYDALEEFAAQEGYVIVKRYGDNISGDSSKRDGALAPFIVDLLADLKIKKPDAILVAALDRLTRTTWEQGYLLTEISVQQKIPMYFSKEKVWTIDRETGSINEDVINRLSADTTPQKERENIVERTKIPRITRGEKGFYIGHLADGFCVNTTPETDERGRRIMIKEIDIDDNRKGVIERIYKLFLKGYPYRKIAAILNADNIPTCNRYRLEHLDKFGYKKTYRGKDGIERERAKATWTGSLVSQVLSNPWYKGERKYGKNDHLTHKAIISKKEWDEVERLRAERKGTFRGKKKASKHLHLLAELIYCGKCNEKMYGHYTGLNNHYYCSSIDNGKPCGLEGVCKENIEAIVYESIISCAANSLFDDEESALVDFFKIDRTKISEYEEIIEDNTKVIKKKNNENELILKEIDAIIEQLISANAEGNGLMAGKYKDLLLKKQTQYEKNVQEITNLEAENRGYNRIIHTNSNLKDVFKRLGEKMELEEIRELFLKVIDKVYIYNGGKRKDVIRIIFKNGNRFEVVYSSSLMRGKYIKLSEPLYYDNENNVISSSIYPIAISESGKMAWSWDSLNELELFIGNTNYQIFEEGFPVETFVRQVRNSGLALPYNRLEPEPDVAKEQREYQKEWRKKYNTGNPTSQPYVLRNETYEEIVAKRRKLYHRRERIKRNKSKSPEEKEKELAETKRQLDILTIQVPTFRPRKNSKHQKGG